MSRPANPPFGTPTAERRLNPRGAPRRSVVVSLGKPRKTKEGADDWTCPFRIKGAGMPTEACVYCAFSMKGDLMVRTALVVLIVTVVAAGSAALAQQQARPYRPITQEMLLNPSPDDWLMFSRTYDAQRYQPAAPNDPAERQPVEARLVQSDGDRRRREHSARA